MSSVKTKFDEFIVKFGVLLYDVYSVDGSDGVVILFVSTIPSLNSNFSILYKLSVIPFFVTVTWLPSLPDDKSVTT